MSGALLFDVPQPSVAIAGSDRRFPVHRIYCIGQNYVAHAHEMGNDPDREPPVFFLKPADSIVEDGVPVSYPPRTGDLHHEIELVVAIGGGGRDIPAAAASGHVFGYAVGVDLTRRDLQKLAKRRGGPWDASKGFEQAAPITRLHTAEDIGHPDSGRIWLSVNGEPRQEGDLGELIWSVPEAIAELSTLFTLAQGDLIYTGTPAGVGPISAGDTITGGIDGVDDIRFDIV